MKVRLKYRSEEGKTKVQHLFSLDRRFVKVFHDTNTLNSDYTEITFDEENKEEFLVEIKEIGLDEKDVDWL